MRAFKAKFAGHCVVCPLPIKKGQRIFHDGGGYRHTDCEEVARATQLAAEAADSDARVRRMARR